MDREIALRPATDADLEFLRQLYRSTREDELDLTDWDEDQKAAFVAMQFSAQHRYYGESYPEAQFDVILLRNEPIGRLYVDRRPDQIRIVDISLLPAYRSQGLGSLFLQRLLTEGQRRRAPVTIHVERFNPAMHLYERLGFRVVEDKGVYLFMEWSPKNETTNEIAAVPSASTRDTTEAI